MQQKLIKLKKYLDRLSYDTGWYIMIDDHYGVLRNSEAIGEYLSSRRWHTNPYCMWIKQSEKMHRLCVEQQSGRRDETKKRKKGGWHVCYCGVAEYTLPVFLGDVHAFTVAVTGFSGDIDDDTLARAASIRESDISELESLRRRYLGVPTNNTESQLESYIEMIGIMLADIFDQDPLLSQRNDAATVQQGYVLQALDYIEKHYTESLTPEYVAQRCNVSLSYLQHLFVQLRGEGIASAIRRRRMQYACELLSGTDRSVRNIAISCGFYDPDYFSVMFKRIYGVTPLKFRKRGQ